jgi:PAS domain-containing protein
MEKPRSQLITTLANPAFRLLWVLVAIAAAAFALDFIVFANSFLLLIAGALLLLIAILAVSSTYAALQSGSNAAIDDGELNAVLEGIDDAIIVYEEGFRAIFFNPAAEKLFQASAHAVVGHVFSPRDIETEGCRLFSHPLRRVFSRGQKKVNGHKWLTFRSPIQNSNCA